MTKDTTKIDKIEDFENISNDMRVLAYSPSANTVGRIKINSIIKTNIVAGARWELGSASPEGEPYGDIEFLRSLSEVLQLGGYLVKNDHSRQRLSSTNHFKLENGTAAVLDGTMGHYQWGWGVPFYYAKWKDSTYFYEAISTGPIGGAWNYKIPVASMSAAGAAALDRTNNILVSYCNRSTQYRGGVNNSNLDSAWNTQLGKPVVNINSNLYQTYAEKNGDRWGASMFMMTFIVGALMRIVFHNRNGQAGNNAALTTDGLHQGGLGMGVDNMSSTFGYWPICDIDALADKGDALGVFEWDVKNGDNTVAVKNIPVFYGLKNFYHYLWHIQHGVVLNNNSNTTKDVYIKKVWNSDAIPLDTLTGMEKIGTIPASNNGWNYPSDMNLEHLCLYPLSFGGSTATNYSDAFYGDGATSGLRALAALSYASNGSGAGPCALTGDDAPSDANGNFGAFLCEAAEDWDTTPFWVA
ncbi:MAG: hypothetical protein LKE54_04390 [Prevotella sp.]|jgi:hypothetical protein|nr:hypothetical protein [Prevotella sp.]MCH3994281.1 hypothetical protein [Prevotella sp.]